MDKFGTFQVFVVSLDRATERREYMKSLASRLGLSANIISAVDGKTLTAEQRSRYNSRRARQVYGCEMSDNEIACYLSHLSIYQRMVDEDIETALIMEDDISCVGDLKTIVEEVLSVPAAGWQVVRLQSTKRSVSAPDNPNTAGAGEAVAKVGDRQIYRVRTSVLGGCAYLIRKTAAAAMLARSQHIDMPIDQTLDRYWENGIIPYVLRPMPVWHEDIFHSEIGQRGRALVKKAKRGVVLQRRIQRMRDSISKRIFWLAFRIPSVGSIMSSAGIASARMGLLALWGAPVLEKL